ncbi:hypothetical protein M9435_005485 [Picochlorum sp. BPE23]|nr:hypothetical protein M9435_005485 [Picochlorum sp. BPE23]
MLIFGVCLVFRLCCALCLSTAFAPDEFWQGPEVAHKLVFGYGHLTWEWGAGLRSYVHPLLYGAFYYFLRLLGLDTRYLIFKGPQLLHSVFAAWTDVSVYRLTLVYFRNERLSRIALMCQLLNWFNAYCLVRSYSSSVEACLMAHAMYQVSALLTSSRDISDPLHHIKWIVFAALSIVFRPASALFWACVALYIVSKLRGRSKERIEVIVLGIVIGTLVIGLSCCVDRLFYGRWEFVPWNFFKFNLLENKSNLYGKNTWHANFTEHLPSMLLSFIPFFVIGCFRLLKAQKGHFIAAGTLYMVLYSLPAHKEIRFLIPALQLFIPVCAAGLASFLASNYGRKIAVIALLFGIQMMMFLYFGRYHQRAQIEVMDIISDFRSTAHEDVKVLFLTPCHSTPYYSSLHRKIDMRFLDCSPTEFRSKVYEINKQERKWLPFPREGTISGLSEREYFEKHPAGTLSSMLNSAVYLPDLVVSFSSTSREIEPVLQKNSYTLQKKLSNCLLTFEDSSECIIDIWVLR